VLTIPSEAEVFYCGMERSCKLEAFHENAFRNYPLLSMAELNLYRKEHLKTSYYNKQHPHFVCSWNMLNLLSML